MYIICSIYITIIHNHLISALIKALNKDLTPKKPSVVASKTCIFRSSTLWPSALSCCAKRPHWRALASTEMPVEVAVRGPREAGDLEVAQPEEAEDLLHLYVIIDFMGICNIQSI